MIIKQLNKQNFERYLQYVKRIDKDEVNGGSVKIYDEWLVKENKEGLLKYMGSAKNDTR